MLEESVIVKVNYFVNYWRDFLYSDSIEADLTHTVVYNPKELFQEFADEISRKKFNNKNNKDFFVKSTNEIYNFKIKSTNFLKPDLLLIKQQFGKKTDFPYLLHLLSIVDRKLSSTKLGFNCIDELEKILTDNTELNSSSKEKIQTLVKFIIFEFVSKECSIKSIQNFVHNIFDEYIINQDGILCTEFPHNLKVSFFTDIDSTEFETYQNKIKEIIDNLDLSKRLLSLKNYLNKEPEELTYIFQIKGLKGNIDREFGNTRIYNPQTTQLIKNYPEGLNLFDELFGSNNYIYCNGAVTLKVVDSEYAKKNAALQLSKVIDILVSAYNKYELPIRINTNKILVCDENGNQRGMSDSLDSDVLYHHKSINIEQSSNTEYLANYYNSTLTNKLKVDSGILESLHWRRKAIESFNTNDRILWYWISIENLFKDTSLIFDVLPKLFAVSKLYKFTWKHYYVLQHIEKVKVSGYFRKDLEFPEELCERIGFRKQEGESIHLRDFINNIADLKEAIANNCLLHDQLNFLEQIFNDSKSCIELL